MSEREAIAEAEARSTVRLCQQAIAVAEACTAHNRDLAHLGSYGAMPSGGVPLACIQRTLQSGQRLAAAIERLAQDAAMLESFGDEDLVDIVDEA